MLFRNEILLEVKDLNSKGNKVKMLFLRLLCLAQSLSQDFFAAIPTPF